jgi:GT2 family glycosyltransferase
MSGSDPAGTGASARDGGAGDRRYGAQSVTLAVVTMDRFESTVETLLQLDLSAFGEVLVVDDSADDALQQWCADRPIRYCCGPGENLQVARNLAVAECASPILAFVDDDVLLPTDFADRVAAAFTAHPGAVAVGGPTLSTAPADARDLCYRQRMTVDAHTGTIHDDSYRWVPDAPTRVGLLKGANMCFLRAPLEHAGGFDPAYGGPAQREDTDVVVRLQRYGEVVYDPALTCLHKQTGGDDFSPDLVEWRFRNHGYFVLKNLGRLAFVLGFLSIFLGLCGNPDSLAQLAYRRTILKQGIAVTACLRAYLDGGARYRSDHFTDHE